VAQARARRRGGEGSLGVGRFTGRREDDRLLTGKGRYAADWNLPAQACAAFVRSDRAHARIVSVETGAAAAVRGVLKIFTGADVEGLGTPEPWVKFPGRGGMKLIVPRRRILALDRVRFVGEALAMVVAETAQAAQDAADLIEVRYEELPAVVDAGAALAPGAPQLHEVAPGNLAFDYEYGDEKAVEAAFARAAHVTRLVLESTRVSGTPLEPKACVASFDAASGAFDLYTGTQGMSMVVTSLAETFGLPAERFRVHAHDVGGAFGVRSQAYPEHAAALFAARALGRPVKWVGSRFETIVSDHHGRGVRLGGALALDAHGRFLALRFDWLCDAGAYLSQSGPLINTRNPSTHAINAYAIPALYGRHRLALTNTTPTTAYRGAGRPNVTYLVERLVDEAARETGLDRIELRRRNLIPKDAFPYRTPTSTYDSGDPPGLLEKAIEHSQWQSFSSRREDSLKVRKLRGLGCAVFIEPAGGGVFPTQEAAIRFGESGEVTLYTLSGASGQGHETVFPEIVARRFGIDASRVVLRASDPHGPALVGAGTVGSRSIISHGGALARAADEAIRKGLDLAAEALETAAADLEFGDGRYRVKGTDVAISFDDVARRYGPRLDATGEIPTPLCFPSGAHVAEVEIDPETGAVELLRYVAVDDCGKIVSHALVEGQLHGGIAQGQGQVLAEHCLYDPASGQLLTGTFMDYAMPRASDQAKALVLDEHNVPSPTNPLGAKGVGEAGTVGAIPAIANAVIDALRPLGIHHLDFPYTPARVWTAIRSRA
jgi:carbon-monoxide dehydrogenase large subunit